MSQPRLSIVIPAYNEARRLPKTLPQVAQFVEQQDFPVEVLLVNNRSTDDTGAIAASFAETHPFFRVIDQPIPGKGAAVKAGLEAASGEMLFMADADLSMPIEQVLRFIPPYLQEVDIAIASRELPGSNRIGEPPYRHLMGRIFNLVVKTVAMPGLQDTQCGFKCFRREVALDILPFQTIDGWTFDVELLFIARKKGYQIQEVAIDWHYRQDSRVSAVRDTLEMVLDTIRIRLNDLRGKYNGPA